MSQILPPSGANYFGVEVANAQVPKEGPKAVAIAIPFTTSNTSFVLKQLLSQSLQFMTMVQGAFVDNSNNPEALYIETSVLYQRMKIKAGQMGYIPLLAPRNCDVTFTSSGASEVNIILLNVPVPAAVWDTNETAQSYTAVPASSAVALGLTGGAVGDYLEGLLIVPATTSPDPVTITDGSGAAITVFAGGATSVSNLVAFYIPLGIQSVSGGWTITTGANVSVLATGQFT